MVWAVAPEPATVIVPLRDAVLVFGWHATVKEPLLLPDPGLTDNQLKDSETVQEVLELTLTVLFSPEELKLRLFGDTVR